MTQLPDISQTQNQKQFTWYDQHRIPYAPWNTDETFQVFIQMSTIICQLVLVLDKGVIPMRNLQKITVMQSSSFEAKSGKC